MGSSDAFLRWADATPAELHEAVVKGAVGQMAGRFYGENGAQLDLSLNRRIISVNLADIRRVATKLIVAEGAVKAQALLAAINGGLVDVLVVDPLLADAVAQLA
jgi:DNA-binding transcriptional regulator LsrR (DeoR family)